MNDEDEIKPVSAGDDFSDDTQSDDVNPVDSELDEGIGQDALLEDDTDEETLTPDSPSDNPLETSSDLDEVDGRLVEEKENAGDVVINPTEETEEEDEAK
ncbi:MAG: hypothetical protein ABI721_03890 [Candidatus Dojkabacteria bacterium]